MTTKRTRRVVVVGSLVLVVAAGALSAVDSPSKRGCGPTALRAAIAMPPTVAPPPKIMTGPRGRYRRLLRKLPLPGDRKTYGDFYDWGYWSGTAYRGHKDLPKGYWVYVYPHWLIYAEDATRPAAKPAVAPTPTRPVASPWSGDRNYGTIGKLYVDGGGIYFTLTGGETAMKPKVGFYHLSMSAANYESMRELLYRAADKRWVVHARTDKELNSDRYGRVRYLVVDF